MGMYRKNVQQLLGHTTIYITHDRYSHALSNAQGGNSAAALTEDH